MGLLDDYAPDLTDIEVPSFEVPDGNYNWELVNYEVREGTSKDAEQNNAVFSYLLGDTGKQKQEWFKLPKDWNNKTEAEVTSLGYLKGRIMSLGFEAHEVNGVGPDDVIGLTGTFTLLTKNGFQNIRSFKLDDDGANAFEKPAPPVAAAPKRTRRTKAQMEAAKAPQPPANPTDPDDDEGDDEPVTDLGNAPTGVPVQLPEQQPEESDADRKARIAARRAARAAAAPAAAAVENPFGA